MDWAPAAPIGYSAGIDLSEPVRTAIEQIARAWVCSLDQDGADRPNGQLAEITQSLDVASWTTGSRAIVRRDVRIPARS